MRKAWTTLLTLLLLAACAGDSSDDPRTSTTSAPTTTPRTTMQVSATTAPTDDSPEVGEPVDEAASGSPEMEVVTDLVFRDADDWFPRIGEMDVMTPAGDGPWAVVVAFYGGLNSDYRFWMRPMAEDIAKQGRVVFVPAFGVTSRMGDRGTPLSEQFEVLSAELACAVVVAKANAERYGGDPDHLTLFGYSGGGNSAVMTALAPSDVLETCSETGPVAMPDAVVSVESDLLLGDATWDSFFEKDPEAFYSATPWRHADGSAEFPIHLMAVDNPQGYERGFGDDPGASFLNDRHIDIDLIAELTELGLLDDRNFSIRDGQEWAYRALAEAGYEVTWTLLPDSRHASLMDVNWALSDESWDMVVKAVVNAESS